MYDEDLMRLLGSELKGIKSVDGELMSGVNSLFSRMSFDMLRLCCLKGLSICLPFSDDALIASEFFSRISSIVFAVRWVMSLLNVYLLGESSINVH